MTEKFEKERAEVLEAARKGIIGNIKLSRYQQKYIKNLLLFALMNASVNETVTNQNFIKLVNKLFKRFLLKIIKESLADDEDWDEDLEVELNNIIASEALLKAADMQQIFTPSNILKFLKISTSGLSQKDLIKKIMAARNAKVNHRELPEERAKRKQNQREYELARQRQRMMERGARTHS